MRVVGTRIPTTGEDRKIYSTVDSTATAGQTVFAVNYDEGKVAVWLNGIRLVQGQDFSYTASGVGSQITLSSGIVANDYVEVVGYQGIYSGNALVEDRFVVGTSSTGSGGSYTNSTTVFPVANNTGDLVCVYRNGIKLVHTTDFVVSASGNTVTLQSASNTADEITVHVIGILQHSNFVPTSGGTFTGTVAHTGTLNVSGGTLTTSTAQKQTIVQAGPGSGTLDVSSGTLTTSTAQKDAIVDGSTAIARSGNNLTFAGEATVASKLNSAAGTSLTLQSPSNAAVIINTNGANERVRVTSAGNVGIGCTPTCPVTIKKTVSSTVSTANNHLNIGNDQSGNNNVWNVGFGYQNSTHSPAIIGYTQTAGTSYTKGDLLFYTRDVETDTAPLERMRISSSGSITTPNGGEFNGTIGSSATFPDGAAIEIQDNVSTSAGVNGNSGSTHASVTFISTNVIAGYKYLVMASGGYGGYNSGHSSVHAYYGIRMDGASNTDEFNTLLTFAHGQISPPSVQMVFTPSTTETVEWKLLITGSGSSTVYWQASSNYPIRMTVVTFKH